MSFRRVGGLAAVALSIVLWMACGDVYRPVVIPINITPPSTANFHSVFGITGNVPNNSGSALQIDVAGDSNIGEANMGVNPTHGAILPNGSRVFVASAGTINSDGTVNVGQSDIITSFIPAADNTTVAGLGPTATFTLPNIGPDQISGITAISEAGNLVTVTLSTPLAQAQVGGVLLISGVIIQGVNVPNPAGYDGSFTISSVSGTTIQYVDSVSGLASAAGGTAAITAPLFCSYLPDFVATSQNTAVFVANYGVENQASCNFTSTDSVAMVNSFSNAIVNIAYLNPSASIPAPHPVAMVETPDAQNLYVVNEGNNTVMDLSPIDMSTIATITVGSTPVWAAVRVDGRRIYVVTQGDGNLYTIRTDTNAIVSTQSVGGPGANFVLYDSNLNRLYVTNPTSGEVYVFSAATDPPTPLVGATGALNIPRPSACAGGSCSSVSPVSVAALPDGTRFYVASYVTQTACSDRIVGASHACMIPMATIYDAASFTVKPTSPSPLSPSLPLLTNPPFASGQYAVLSASSCVPAAVYTPLPGSARFRMFSAASIDSSHVYFSICDAGTIADIRAKSNPLGSGGSNNTPDILITDLPTPFGAGPPGAKGEPPTQNPLFLFPGQ